MYSVTYSDEALASIAKFKRSNLASFTHHLHIVTVNVDENGKRLNRDFLYRRSDSIRSELEQKYGLHPAERKNQRLDNPLRNVDASAGDVKKQVAGTVKALNGQMCIRDRVSMLSMLKSDFSTLMSRSASSLR